MSQRLLTAVYDLAHGTVAYDFITWLVRAKLEQQRAGAQHLHVVILPYSGGLGDFARRWGPHDVAATQWRLWNIVMAACPLAGATVTLAHSREIAETLAGPVWFPPGKTHFLGPLVQAARAGEAIPLLSATTAALRWAARWCAGWRTVTLTMRRNNAADGRDSSADWSAFAQWLRARAWRVMILPDTVDVMQRPYGELATLSIDLRAALYASAAMNCFVNNGPLVLAWHSGAPFLGFNAALPADPWRAHWEKHLHLAHGDQLPWASDHQRLVYRPDTLLAMTEEFQRWENGKFTDG